MTKLVAAWLPPPRIRNRGVRHPPPRASPRGQTAPIEQGRPSRSNEAKIHCPVSAYRATARRAASGGGRSGAGLGWALILRERRLRFEPTPIGWLQPNVRGAQFF